VRFSTYQSSPSSTPLLVIVAVLAVTVVASAAKARRGPGARAHAGSLRDRREDPDDRNA
jgi:hypothetical protein